MSRKFAEGTDVSVAKSRAELDEPLTRYGADRIAVFTAAKEAAVVFEMKGRRLMFRLPLPGKDEHQFTHANFGARGVQPRPSPQHVLDAWEKACRQKWRALLLAVKAKLVSVEEGVETFDEAFLAQIVLPSGRTVGEESVPRITQMYKENKMQPLLPGPSS